MIETLKKRREFLAVRGGTRVPTRAFLIEAKAPAAARRLPADSEPGPRFGFTVTKKLGNAVRRNYIRRRLKHAVRVASAATNPPPLNYVVVARHAAKDIAFEALVTDMTEALRRISRRSSQPAESEGAKPSKRHSAEKPQ